MKPQISQYFNLEIFEIQQQFTKILIFYPYFALRMRKI